MKNLKDILYKVAVEAVVGSTEIDVQTIEFDSRKVILGALFVAQKGLIFDGHKFIDKAIDNGATVIVCEEFPKVILGLSDHTLGDITVLGAVTLGAKVIEKHFTDDIEREGPDHSFSMNPASWKKMVQKVRVLESALGDENKKVEENELSTIILQRRCIRTNKNISKGNLIKKEDLEFQRPAPKGSLSPKYESEIIGKIASKDISKEDILNWENIQK